MTYGYSTIHPINSLDNPLQHTNMAAEACTDNIRTYKNLFSDVCCISQGYIHFLGKKHLKKHTHTHTPQQRLFLALNLIHFCLIVKRNSLYQHNHWRHRRLIVFKFTGIAIRQKDCMKSYPARVMTITYNVDVTVEMNSSPLAAINYSGLASAERW